MENSLADILNPPDNKNKPKCTWVGCKRIAHVPQVSKDGQEWAKLCRKHDSELKKLQAPGGDAQALLSGWVKAQGGAKVAAGRMVQPKTGAQKQKPRSKKSRPIDYVENRGAPPGGHPGAGAPGYQPTPAERQMVQVMVAGGFTQLEIGHCLGVAGIDEKTLRKHFSTELKIGTSKINALCVNGIVKNMVAGNVVSQIFWAKTRLRWREDQSDTEGTDRLNEVLEVMRRGPVVRTAGGPALVPSPDQQAKSNGS